MIYLNGPVLNQFIRKVIILLVIYHPGADPGFFLGGGARVSCSSSTPINHIVFFFAEYQLYKKTAGHLRGGGGGMRTPAPSPYIRPCLLRSPTAAFETRKLLFFFFNPLMNSKREQNQVSNIRWQVMTANTLSST